MTDSQTSEYQKLLLKAREELQETAKDLSRHRNRFTILSLLTRLRQAACDAALLPWIGADGATEAGGKISVLLDRAEELYLGGKKVLVFSQFTKFLELIKASLISKIGGGNIYELTGSTRDRATPVESFQNAKGGARIVMQTAEETKKFLKEHSELCTDFEYMKGNMDDVFLSVTGKKAEGGM